MPRINIEDTFWSDPRFHFLIDALSTGGSFAVGKALATGWIVQAWVVAQRYWIDKDAPRSPIPKSIWELSKFPDAIIESKLATRSADGSVLMVGVEEAFDWIAKCRESGSRGGKAKKSNDSIKGTVSDPIATLEGFVPSSSSSSSSSNSNELINTVPPVAKKRPSRRAVAVGPQEGVLEGCTSSGSRVWEAYRAAMEKSWNLSPPRNAAVNSQVKKLIEYVGEEKALQVAAYYPTRRKDFYVRNGHAFKFALADHQVLLLEISGGLKLTNEIVKDIVNKEDSENYTKFVDMKPLDPLFMDDEQFAEYNRQRAIKEQNGQTPLLEGEDEDVCF